MVTAVNEELADDPERINADPYGDGWIVKLQPSGAIDESELLSPEAYQSLLDEEEA
jgi:glycine cleavage system H protein